MRRLADLAQCSNAVDVGQLNVHQYQVWAFSQSQPNPFGPGSRFQRLVSLVSQHVAHQLHVLLVVLDDQDSAHAAASRRRSGKVNEKVDPTPGLLSSRIVPP